MFIYAMLPLFLMLFAAECFAVRPYTPVQPDPVLEPWRWTAFPELNGLGLRCMAEDREGNMWFGVDEGAVRYDGLKWTTFTEQDGLYGAPVTAMLGARDGSVYAGTPMGISRFANGKWHRVFPDEGGLHSAVRKLMEASDSSIWAVTFWGALRLGAGGPVFYTSADMAHSLRILIPGVNVTIVPDAVAHVRSWESFPLRVGILHTSPPDRFIWIVAPGGPGEAPLASRHGPTTPRGIHHRHR